MRSGGISLLLCCLSLLQGQALSFLHRPPQPPPIRIAFVAGPDGGNGTFDQYIDHSNRSLGTFSQKYFWNTTYWKGPGSPVWMLKGLESLNFVLT